MADCTKIKYPNPLMATRALRSIVAKTEHRKLKIPVAIYPCEFCRAWHLTSQSHTGKSRRWNVVPC